MNYFNFTVLVKKVIRRNSPLLALVLIIAAALTFGNRSFAEAFEFRVAFADIPGVEEIEAGNIQAGITMLEDQLKLSKSGSTGDILATLCAAHILSNMLDMADRRCIEAVEGNPSEIAYNNRGVYRAHTGNLSGAREDFRLVEPRRLEAYLDELKTTDVRLVAIGNFRLIDELLARHKPEDIQSSRAVSAAEIESLSD